jgi:dihydrodiol dehydrogenase / D-xylose 1-dehydrogenase (NADP)
MVKRFKWGIVGPGSIAHKFAGALKSIPEAEFYAVASRSRERALEFGRLYGVENEKCFGSYEELFNDNEVEIVYIAVPHSFHKELSIAALKSGKAVLCEKPAALNSQEAAEIIKASRENCQFYMEAMWTRFLPVIREVIDRIRKGVIGDIMMIQADFGFKAEFNPEDRLFKPSLGGGSLLDVGIYPVSLATSFLGTNIDKIFAVGDMGITGVEEQCAVAIRYKNGELASLSSSLRTNTPQAAHIMGTKGRIYIPDFWRAESAVIITEKGQENINIPYICNGYEYEALEVMNCISEGKLQSDIMPQEETLKIMNIMDEIAALIKY